jgi:hypothetical protein
MQGGQDPGRGVYVVRRIVAVLVILLLLVLLGPRACQAILGPQGGSDTGDTEAPEETTEVASSAGEEETVPDEETVISTETATEQADIADGRETEDSMEIAGDESLEAQYIGTELDLVGVAVGLEAPVGDLTQTAPVPDLGAQQVPQPVAFEGPIPFEDPAFFGEDPAFFGEDPAFFGEDPAFFGEDPAFFEEPTVVLDEPTDDAASEVGPMAIISSD